MSKVQFVPSLSLAALVTMLREFKQAGQRFILVGIQPSVRGTLAVTHLDRLFEIYEDVKDAVEQIHLPDE
jgi:anti-anti-sigma factor